MVMLMTIKMKASLHSATDSKTATGGPRDTWKHQSPRHARGKVSTEDFLMLPSEGLGEAKAASLHPTHFLRTSPTVQVWATESIYPQAVRLFIWGEVQLILVCDLLICLKYVFSFNDIVSQGLIQLWKGPRVWVLHKHFHRQMVLT